MFSCLWSLLPLYFETYFVEYLRCHGKGFKKSKKCLQYSTNVSSFTQQVLNVGRLSVKVSNIPRPSALDLYPIYKDPSVLYKWPMCYTSHTPWSTNEKYHCVKSVQIWNFFWSIFSRIRTEYGDLLTDFGPSSHSALVSYFDNLERRCIPMRTLPFWNCSTSTFIVRISSKIDVLFSGNKNIHNILYGLCYDFTNFISHYMQKYLMKKNTAKCFNRAN